MAKRRRSADEIRKSNRDRQRRHRERKRRARQEAVAKADLPAASRRRALETLGYPGRRKRTAFLPVDETVLKEFRGAQMARTLDRMLLDPVIAGAIDRASLLLAAADWSLVAGDPEDERSVEFRDRLQMCVDGLYPGWQATVQDAAEAYVWGFSVAEILYRRFDDGFIGWGGFLPIMQRTIQDWKIDQETGRVEGVYQMPEDDQGRWLPGWKVLHFRAKPAAGLPEGKSLARNSFLAWTDKQELRRVVKIGIKRDLTGMPDMQVPERVLATNATPEEQNLRTEAETLVREVEQDERYGIVRPAELDEHGNPTGYAFGLVQSPGTRTVPLKDVWDIYNLEIALGLMADDMLLGSDKTGSYALAKEKTKWVARSIGTLLGGIAEHMNQVAIPTVAEFNPTYRTVAPPYFQHGDVEQLPLEELANYFAKLGPAGFINTDEETERFLRARVAAPQSPGEEEL